MTAVTARAEVGRGAGSVGTSAGSVGSSAGSVPTAGVNGGVNGDAKPGTNGRTGGINYRRRVS